MKSIIEISDLGKRYLIGHSPRAGTLCEAITHWGKRESYEEFWALRHLSLEIAPGDRVGVIGSNGSGKSTLLKILSRITTASEGRAVIRGGVSSLLEVGTGFHPELTGRENIFLNGAVLGVPRSAIRERFDEIVSFAGVEKFIDTPVKRYSSGMFVRLAFSLAAHLNSEILLLDEVLAVGDAEFQERCLAKIRELTSGEGRTVIFVSHNMMAVRSLCNRAVVLKNGTAAAASDDVDACIGLYLRERGVSGTGVFEWRRGDGDFRHTAFTPVAMTVSRVVGGALTGALTTGDAYRVDFSFNVEEPHPGLIFDFAVSTGGALLFSASPWECPERDYRVRRGENHLSWIIPGGFLNTLNYHIAVRASALGAGGFRMPEKGLPVLDLPVSVRSYKTMHGHAADRRLLHPELRWEFHD